MNQFKRGTPLFGLFLGVVFLLIGTLLLTIGFWKTLLLSALFAVGYFLGAVHNKGAFFRNVANRVIPEKKEETIDVRETVTREQEAAFGSRGGNGSGEKTARQDGE